MHPLTQQSSDNVMQQIAAAQAARLQAPAFPIRKAAPKNDFKTQLRALVQQALVGGLAEALKKRNTRGH